MAFTFYQKVYEHIYIPRSKPKGTIFGPHQKSAVKLKLPKNIQYQVVFNNVQGT